MSAHIDPRNRPNKARRRIASSFDWTRRLGKFLSSFGARGSSSGELNDPNADLNNKQAFVDQLPLDHPDRPEHLQGLAVSFTDRYRRLGNIQDLEAALRIAREAVNLTPADHPGQTGHLQYQEILDLLPADHPSRPEILHNLAETFGSRYKKLRELKDLEVALQLSQTAVDLTSTRQPGRPERLRTLGIMFSARYRRLGNLNDLEADLKDLETAMQKFQEALDLTPIDHPDREGLLQGLAACYRDRFDRLKNVDDLRTALQ
ncbi:hypothetical protein B0H17DRAFT_1182769 [Mycena rosella]|uniref:TPR-like protein n=1 Tax=Mycena rosella TaxID=1033263 RepID=A0AAD7D3D4_MYCRO|nr:hypothetical protein B0H17DRAFT_1182769 [Mycena rosella]